MTDLKNFEVQLSHSIHYHSPMKIHIKIKILSHKNFVWCFEFSINLLLITFWLPNLFKVWFALSWDHLVTIVWLSKSHGIQEWKRFVKWKIFLKIDWMCTCMGGLEAVRFNERNSRIDERFSDDGQGGLNLLEGEEHWVSKGTKYKNYINELYLIKLALKNKYSFNSKAYLIDKLFCHIN